MVDYFNHLNKKEEGEEEQKKHEAAKEKDQRAIAFCEQNLLQLKSIKEIHALCQQLQRLVQDELLVA